MHPSSPPRLRVVARYGTGTSNVDLAAAAAHGVAATNTPGANAEAVAELTVGLLFALARLIPSADRAVHGGGWPAIRGIEIQGKTVGIVGLGRIGQGVARRAAALGCAVVAYDPVPDEADAATHGVRLAPLMDVVAAAYFLSFHLPLTRETEGLVDHALLGCLREEAYLVNTARGELIVERDLLWALDTGRLRGAAPAGPSFPGPGRREPDPARRGAHRRRRRGDGPRRARRPRGRALRPAATLPGDPVIQ